jgi:hypothetical protein
VKRKAIGVLVAAFFGTAALAEPPAKIVGVYHWGGQVPRSVSQGVEQIAGLGGRIVRIALSPRHYSDYEGRDACYSGFSLAAIAQDPDVKKALDNPSIDLFMFTAYDGTSFGDCVHHRYLNPGFYTPENTAALIQEYSDFTLYLYQTYQHTHKRFIISNWEADNDVYCGAAYAYATDRRAREACDSSYAYYYDGNSTPEQSLEGLQHWFQLREKGIVDGRNRAALMGMGGMRVYFAPEFSIVHVLHDAGLKSVLYDVVPKVIFDYVSYSTYESINRSDPDSALGADLNLIQDTTGSSSIIFGEIGFSRSEWGSDVAVSRSARVIAAAISWGVSLIFQWNLYDQDSSNDYGLIDTAGDLTPLGAFYKGQVSSQF